MNKCTVKQMCTKCMVQNADNQNCWCQLRCRLNVSSEFASATSCGRAFQAGLVRGRNAYLNMSTTDGKRWNCMDGIPVELQPARLWSCTSWSVCCGVYECAGVPIRDQTPSPIQRRAVCCVEKECSSQIGLLGVVSFPAYRYISADMGPRCWNSIPAWDGR